MTLPLAEWHKIEGVDARVEGVIGCWFGGNGKWSFIISLGLDSASLASMELRVGGW